MKINRIEKLENNLYKIMLDKEELCVYEAVMFKYDLFIRKQLSDYLLKEVKRENELYVAYEKALDYLQAKMRTKKEVMDYLFKEKQMSNDSISFAMEKLEKQGYIDDVKYARTFIERSLKITLDGPVKMKMKLENLGVATEILLPLFQEIDESVWVQRILKIMSKREQNDHKSSEKIFKEKLCQYLIRNGYPKDLVREEVDDLEFERDMDMIQGEFKRIKEKLEKKYSGTELLFYIKTKLYQKGYSQEDINFVIEQEM